MAYLEKFDLSKLSTGCLFLLRFNRFRI